MPQIRGLVNMGGTRLRSAGKSAVAVLCAVCILASSLGAVSRAAAADAWETWPIKSKPGLDLKPAMNDNEAAGAWKKQMEESAVSDQERKAAENTSYGTIGWIALGIAAAIGIGIAIASGGSGDSGGSSVVVNPGHH